MKKITEYMIGLRWISTPQILFFIFLSLACSAWGQASKKKELKPEDYDSWHTMYNFKISGDGAWASFHLNYESGSDTLVLQNIEKVTKYYIPAGTSEKFNSNNKSFIYLDGRGLSCINLNSGVNKKVESIIDYKTSADFQYIAGIRKGNSINTTEKELVLVGKEMEILLVLPFVDEFEFSPSNRFLAFTQKMGMESKVGIIPLNQRSANSTILKSGRNKYTKLIWGAQNNLAFLEVLKDNKNNRVHWISNVSKENESHIFDPELQHLNNHNVEVPNTPSNTLHFSHNGERLFFHLQEKIDVPIEDDHGSKVQVWNTKDKVIYPNYAGFENYYNSPPIVSMWDIKKDTIIGLGTKESSTAVWGTDDKYIYTYSLLDNIMPGDDLGVPCPVFVYNLETGGRHFIFNRKHLMPIKVSPTGRYLSYFDQTDWWVYDAQTQSQTNITKNISTVFKDIEYDRSGVVPPYGNPGWTEGDKEILLYDKFDIWAISPNGKTSKNLTNGKNDGISYRIKMSNFLTDSFGTYLVSSFDIDSDLYLEGKHISNGKTGYFVLKPNNTLKTLVYTDGYVKDLEIAKDADRLIYTLERFDQPPLLMCRKKVDEPAVLLHESNPQHKKYNWGKAELVDYKTEDGLPLKGALFYPSQFDKSKKYPMIVFIYQKMSDHLHQYQNPSMYNGTEINISNLTTRGYFVFCPDIVYQINEPAISALKCVTSAVNEVKKRDYINNNKIGLFGHSFGGYETSFIITQTDMFATAITSAGNHNLLSFYLSVAWLWNVPQSARFLNDQFRFEKNYFETPEKYKLNSPIAYAKSINTPVLSITGQLDTNVNWQQSVELYNALRILKKDHIMLIYPGEGHDFFGKEAQRDVTIKMGQWFDHYLKDGESQPWMQAFK